MSKFVEKVDLFSTTLGNLNIDYDQDLLTKVTKGLGPSIYNKDAAFVATSSEDEVGRVKTNFLIKKLGLTESDDLDGGISAVAEKMGKSNPRKHRAVFYYLLVKHFGKESIYS